MMPGSPWEGTHSGSVFPHCAPIFPFGMAMYILCHFMSDAVLVKVSVAVKGHHDHRNFYDENI